MDQPTNGLETLANVLWEERHIAELLLYKLLTAKLVLASDERRFVSLAIAEVERVIEALRNAESRRNATVAAIADRWGYPREELKLAVLAREAPQPWRDVFADHRDGFHELTTQIEEAAEENRRLMSSALEGVRQALDALTGRQPGATYTATGRVAATPAEPSQLDQVL